LHRSQNLEGQSLNSEFAHLLHRLLSSVSALHKSGRWHRDIKPSNIACGGGDDDRYVTLIITLCVSADCSLTFHVFFSFRSLRASATVFDDDDHFNFIVTAVPIFIPTTFSLPLAVRVMSLVVS
jgi:serine/threonine protein kinase